jgi:hypothetical protein
MKTTLTLICAALCCVVASAFATSGGPADTTTGIAFVDNCTDKNPVLSASPSGDATTDVAINSTTVVTAGGAPVTSGKVQFQIATDGAGNPTSVALATVWVRIDTGAGTDVDSNGVACFDVDLDNPGTGVNPVTCDIPLVGFRTHYVGNSTYAQNTSLGTDLTISCGTCGSDTSFTFGIERTFGPGNPCPGTHDCWTWVVTARNCTETNYDYVKIQGGGAAWTDQPPSATSVPDGVVVTPKGKGKNSVMTWEGPMPSGSEVQITVNVCGDVAKKDGITQYLNGPWSVKDANGNLLGGYTGQLSLTTDSTSCP